METRFGRFVSFVASKILFRDIFFVWTIWLPFRQDAWRTLVSLVTWMRIFCLEGFSLQSAPLLCHPLLLFRLLVLLLPFTCIYFARCIARYKSLLPASMDMEKQMEEFLLELGACIPGAQMELGCPAFRCCVLCQVKRCARHQNPKGWKLAVIRCYL